MPPVHIPSIFKFLPSLSPKLEFKVRSVCPPLAVGLAVLMLVMQFAALLGMALASSSRILLSRDLLFLQEGVGALSQSYTLSLTSKPSGTVTIVVHEMYADTVTGGNIEKQVHSIQLPDLCLIAHPSSISARPCFHFPWTTGKRCKR